MNANLLKKVETLECFKAEKMVCWQVNVLLLSCSDGSYAAAVNMREINPRHRFKKCEIRCHAS